MSTPRIIMNNGMHYIENRTDVSLEELAHMAVLSGRGFDTDIEESKKLIKSWFSEVADEEIDMIFNNIMK